MLTSPLGGNSDAWASRIRLPAELRDCVSSVIVGRGVQTLVPKASLVMSTVGATHAQHRLLQNPASIDAQLEETCCTAALAALDTPMGF